MGRHDNDDSVSEGHRKHRKHKKHRKKHDDSKRSKASRRYSASSGNSGSDSSDSYRERKRRKKERKEKKHSRKATQSIEAETPSLERNYQLADALHKLFQEHPQLCSDLPIMLIRMGGGTSFDLSNSNAAAALARVFVTLSPFGVVQETNNNACWKWNGPQNELVLVKVLRAMLDQIGLTETAIHDYEDETAATEKYQHAKLHASSATESVKSVTQLLLDQFQAHGGDLAKELAGLCTMILDGEIIALDTLPDEKLRTGLEVLLQQCGLEKTDMELDDDDDEAAIADDYEPTMGYGLPDTNNSNAQKMLTLVLDVCRASVVSNSQPTRKVKGPMLNPDDYANWEATAPDSSDDEGPAPLGSRKRSPSVPSTVVRAQAEQRARELHTLKTGEASAHQPSDSVREEWMVDPGKFDLLSSIKSGDPAKSRQFQAKSKASDAPNEKIDPTVQAEMDAIMQAHESARGPSLMEIHKQKKADERNAARKDGDISWKWDRDKDLDAGRRVDKNALNMILGGASTELKNKFQGGIG
jgi:hypothetical protein